MKDKIQKFYEDHMIEVQIFTSGVCVGAIFCAAAAIRHANGMEVKSADSYKRDDGYEIIMITHMNDQTTTLGYNPEL